MTPLYFSLTNLASIVKVIPGPQMTAGGNHYDQLPDSRKEKFERGKEKMPVIFFAIKETKRQTITSTNMQLAFSSYKAD